MSSLLRALRGEPTAWSRSAGRPLAGATVAQVVRSAPEVARVYRSVADKLLGAAGVRRVLVCGTQGGEGATTAAIHLAAAAGAAGRRTALVEATGRTPALGALLGEPSARGLVDLCHRGAELEDALHPSGVDGVSALPFGEDGRGMPPLLGTPAFAKVAAELRGRFDAIVYDGGALHPYGEALALKPEVDGLVLLVQADRTESDRLRRAKEMAAAAGLPVLGAVLNRRRYPIPNWLYDWIFGA